MPAKGSGPREGSTCIEHERCAEHGEADADDAVGTRVLGSAAFCLEGVVVVDPSGAIPDGEALRPHRAIN